MSDLADGCRQKQTTPTRPLGARRWRTTARIAALLLLGPLAGTAALATADSDKLLVVDCLLPAQVRQLGTGFTYLAPRQAVKTSAADCERRGGEYVAAERASGAAALRVWLPQAEQGDRVAQTYVGEIFEKGLGAQSDYATAAAWYLKAAQQGYSRAMIDLGFLYEKGLGVEKDPIAALNWYRKASGLTEAIRLAGDGSAADGEPELAKLRDELSRALQQLEQARQDLERERRRSSDELNKLRQERQSAASAGDTAALQRLEKELRAREADARRRDAEFAHLEEVARLQQDKLKRAEQERQSLTARLDEAERAAVVARAELDRRQQATERASEELARVQKEAQALAQQGTAAEAALARVKEMQAELARREREVTEQRAKIASLEQASLSARNRVQGSAAADLVSAGVSVAGPSIQIIDPELVATRSPMVVPVNGSQPYRDIVGRVVAPAGLLSFTVNGRTVLPEANGLFKTRLDIQPASTKVGLVAVDRAGTTAHLDFLLQPDGGGTQPAAAMRPIPAGIKFGRYHALVIGNQRYASLPPLETPEADAKAIAEILKTRYGFEVKLLLNATRYEMLSELNRLRGTLTENDNLLIYYAGHGELDRVNQRGHWLPVDAEPNSDANWISSVAITDILNAMSVKQAIVVADSCYAGALTRSSLARLDVGMSDEARVNWLKSIVKSRSRTVLTSGGVKPVLDGGGGQHSVFAGIFLRILSENTEILEAQRVYQELSARVLNAALKARFEQRPEYGPMRFAGHESGDFLFVPRTP